MPRLSRRRRYLVLVICCLSLFIVGLDTTIVNIALPSIGSDLHASVSGLQWTIDAYALVIAGLLMLSGSTADRMGRRRVFQIGLTHDQPHWQGQRRAGGHARLVGRGEDFGPSGMNARSDAILLSTSISDR